MGRTPKNAAPKEKTAAKGKPKEKTAAKPKKAPLKMVEEVVDVEVLVCKDYVNCRWEITEEGQLVTWQPEDVGRPTRSFVPGKISDVVYDKMCAYVDDDGNKKTVQKLKYKDMLKCKLFFVDFLHTIAIYVKKSKIIWM
jgi:hypothetical protein